VEPKRYVSEVLGKRIEELTIAKRHLDLWGDEAYNVIMIIAILENVM
jgi:hypothetical protein